MSISEGLVEFQWHSQVPPSMLEVMSRKLSSPCDSPYDELSVQVWRAHLWQEGSAHLHRRA